MYVYFKGYNFALSVTFELLIFVSTINTEFHFAIIIKGNLPMLKIQIWENLIVIIFLFNIVPSRIFSNLSTVDVPYGHWKIDV